jgi:hypothetical protein
MSKAAEEIPHLQVVGDGDTKTDAAPPAQPTPSDDRMKRASEAFARFQSIQIDPKATVAARQIITNCIARRPRNNEFVRVNADAEVWTGLVYEDKEEDAYYLVTEKALPYFYASPPLQNAGADG